MQRNLASTTRSSTLSLPSKLSSIVSAKKMEWTKRLVTTSTDLSVIRILANLTDWSGLWLAFEALARPSCACSKSLGSPDSPWKSNKALTQGSSSGVMLRVRSEERHCLKVARVVGEQVGERSRFKSSSLKLEPWMLHWRRKRWGHELAMALAWQLGGRALKGGKVLSQLQVDSRF